MAHMQPHRMYTKTDTYLVLSISTAGRSKRNRKIITLPTKSVVKDITLDVCSLIHVSTSLCISHTAKEMECSKLKWPARSIYI